jgi:hypothetical protein
MDGTSLLEDGQFGCLWLEGTKEQSVQSRKQNRRATEVNIFVTRRGSGEDSGL